MTYNGMKLTYHCAVDRENRFTKIKEQIGFGNVIKEQFVRGCFACLTDTGIIFILDKAKTKIITLYVATIANLYYMYLEDNHIPVELVKLVNKNQKLYTKNEKTIWD